MGRVCPVQGPGPLGLVQPGAHEGLRLAQGWARGALRQLAPWRVAGGKGAGTERPTSPTPWARAPPPLPSGAASAGGAQWVSPQCGRLSPPTCFPSQGH